MLQEKNRLLKISFWTFLISVVILPLFFIPGGSIPVFFGKTFLLSLGVSVSLVLFFIRFIKLKQVSIPSPRNLIFLSPFLILSVSLISSLLSSPKTISFIGYGFEVGTLAFLLLFFLVFFLAILLFPLYKNSYSKLILLIVFSFILLAAFQILRLFLGAGFLSFGIFQTNTDTPIGGWNELALFSGAMVLLSVFFLDRSNKFGRSRGSLLFLLTGILSLILLVVVNFWIAWFLTFFLLFIFIFFQFFRQRDTARIVRGENLNEENKVDDILPTPKFEKKFLIYSLSTLFITLIFILPSGGFLSSYLNNSLAISYIDVKPSWSSTSEVFSQTVKESNKNLFFGSGPNTFLSQWRKFKPIEVNQSDFWNTEFHYGAGLIPTFFVTTGILGSLFWILFILSFFWFGIRYVLKNSRETFSSLFLFLSAYFWIAAFVYPVSHSLFVWTALFSGLFIASAVKSNLPTLKFSPTSKPGVNMILTLVLVLFLTASLFSGFTFFRKTLSARSFNKGIDVFLQGDIKTAENKLITAQKISSNDIISRYLSELYLLESSNLAETISNPTQEDINNFQNILQISKTHAETSVLLNPKSFENWFQLARFYEFIGDIAPDQSGSDDSARMTYERARIFDPKNPLIDLMLARLEFSIGDLNKAEELVKSSLSKKGNYSEAIFLLSRIKALQGNLEEAIISAKDLVGLNPREPSVYFQLGLLFYQNNDFTNASEALNQAILLEPQYANARYFLGLSLAKVGDSLKATEQFEILSQNYPENTDISEILSNLKNEGTIDSNSVEESLESSLPIEE